MHGPTDHARVPGTTLVGKVTTLLHVRTAPTPIGHVNPQILHSAQKNWLDIFTSKSRAHGSISAAAAGRPDSYNTTISQQNFMCRAPSTAVDDSLWHGADVGSSLTDLEPKSFLPNDLGITYTLH